MTASTTQSATASRASDLNSALQEAIAALTILDADKLEKIEGAVSASLAEIDPHALFASQGTTRSIELDEIHASHRLLGTLLASTSLNLNVLERLHSRNSTGDASWVR